MVSFLPVLLHYRINTFSESGSGLQTIRESFTNDNTTKILKIFCVENPYICKGGLSCSVTSPSNTVDSYFFPRRSNE